jgi:DNA-binding CsgD family transcriptional regulator
MAVVARFRGEWDQIKDFPSQRDMGGTHWERQSAMMDALAGVDTRIEQQAPTPFPPYTPLPGINAFLLPTLAAAAFDRLDSGVVEEVEQRLVTWLSYVPTLPRITVQTNLAVGFAVVMRHDQEAAAQLYQALLPWRDLFDVRGGFSYARLLGLLAWTAGDMENAETHFRYALERCKATGFRTEVPRVYRDYATMTVEEHLGHDRSLELIAAGEQAATELGMAPVLERLRHLRERVEASPQARPAYPDGLSEREVEVLRLIAAGKTNQQIADALIISRFTVVRHVTNIFTKTGASNRADATSYAHRHGLADAASGKDHRP